MQNVFSSQRSVKLTALVAQIGCPQLFNLHHAVCTRQVLAWASRQIPSIQAVIRRRCSASGEASCQLYFKPWLWPRSFCERRARARLFVIWQLTVDFRSLMMEYLMELLDDKLSDRSKNMIKYSIAVLSKYATEHFCVRWRKCQQHQWIQSEQWPPKKQKCDLRPVSDVRHDGVAQWPEIGDIQQQWKNDGCSLWSKF